MSVSVDNDGKQMPSNIKGAAISVTEGSVHYSDTQNSGLDFVKVVKIVHNSRKHAKARHAPSV